MGYELHITRAGHWLENTDCKIKPTEWLDLVAGDPSLRIDTRNGEFFADVVDHSGATLGWLNWNEGNISTRNPDRALLAKMLAIAPRLQATVQGEDCERYTSVEDLPERPLDRPANVRPDSGPRYARRERYWEFAAYITIAIVIAAAVIWDLW